eukprot:tig00020951_g16429.t1
MQDVDTNVNAGFQLADGHLGGGLSACGGEVGPMATGPTGLCCSCRLRGPCIRCAARATVQALQLAAAAAPQPAPALVAPPAPAPPVPAPVPAAVPQPVQEVGSPRMLALAVWPPTAGGEALEVVRRVTRRLFQS